MSPVDLAPAANRMATLLDGIGDEMLDRPTPCPDYTLGDLVEHVGGLALAFRGAAEKDLGDTASQGPSGDASRLGDDWRERIPRDLDALAQAWREPAAWDGMTKAGGIDLPGEVAGVVALDELVIHGWDVARASGQAYDCDPASLEAVRGFVEQFSGPGQEDQRAGLFGPVVEVADGASPLDQVIGLTGRDPGWSPT
jgi:uncharacterized protein (TIGR03086 family)